MALLKNYSFVGVALASLVACGPSNSVTRVVSVPIKSDTYIVSGSEKSNGGDESLKVSTGASAQKVALVSLPSSDGSISEQSFTEAIVNAIFDGFFNSGCDSSKILKPQYLSDVTLVLTPLDETKAASAAQISIKPLARGWWQGATWTKAHPFLASGKWQSAGGDVMNGVTAVAGTTGTGSKTIEFAVKDLVTESTTIFEWGSVTALNGFRVEAASGTSIDFHSAQSSWGESYRPHLDFTYTGPCLPPDTNSF
ncbi:MAG: hypothetical protein ABIR96_05845 [Bdellovibrionota bacterium]